jgi:FkbM family methyltransferase
MQKCVPMCDRIGKLLSESVESARERESKSFAAEFQGCDGVVLFGAGRLGRLCARALRRAGIPLRGFCDTNSRLHGAEIDGARVLSPEEAAARHGEKDLFVVAIWTGAARESMAERTAFLAALGCRKVAPYPALAWAYGEDEVPFHSFHRPSAILAQAASIRALAGSLCDAESLATLERDLARRLHARFTTVPPAPDQYFPDFLTLQPDECFVDGGAFDGDTLDEFLRRTRGGFRHYHAIEPDPINVARLRGRLAALSVAIRERVSIHEAALHDRDEALYFAAEGTVGSAVSRTGRTQVSGRRLDTLLVGERVTFLKLDIEGAEPEALMGGTELIRVNRPLVAVCAYHLPDHLWRVPHFLRKILPEHRLFLRCHGHDGWEMVCYAVPPERLRGGRRVSVMVKGENVPTVATRRSPGKPDQRKVCTSTIVEPPISVSVFISAGRPSCRAEALCGGGSYRHRLVHWWSKIAL